MQLTRCLKYLILILFLLTIISQIRAAPTSLIIQPNNGNVTITSNMTFFCEGNDTTNIFSISLYHNLNGTFVSNSTVNIMEVENDSNTLLLCHFNDIYICTDGETGTNSTTDFVSSNLIRGVRVNASTTLAYETTSNVEYEQGTIEFWVSVGVDPSSTSDVILLDFLGDAENEIRIYIDMGTLHFSFYDDSGNEYSSTTNVSSWSQGEWHYVAARWDYNLGVGPFGETIEILADGTTIDQDYPQEEGYAIGTFGAYMYIGSDENGNLQSNSSFDDLRISNIARSGEEINNTYSRVIGNHTNESANWTFYNIPDGTYIWNCLVLNNNSNSSFNSTNFTFSIDTISPPVTESITLSPSDADGIDPLSTINLTANIADSSGVSAAILEYKYDVDWINISMTNMSLNLWNAAVTTISSERTYYYRVWANDSLGNMNVSNTFNLNVTNDYTWNRSPTFLEAYGLINSVENVGLIRINNTGDDTLVFTIIDDWPIDDVYYNTTSQFSVISGEVIDINVTATFASTDGVNNLTINISSEPSAPGKTSSPTYQTTVATMNSYSGGAYLDVSITSISSVVTQSSSGITINATIKNIGNETAENVTINWTLHTGWINTTGNTTYFLGNVSPQITNYSNLLLNITSDARAGVVTICINATTYDDINDTACENVEVQCSSSDGVCGSGCVYTTDDDCSPTVITTTGSGGGGYATLPSAEAKREITFGIGVEVPEIIEVNRGDSVLFHVNISNNHEDTEIDNTTLKISGHPQAFIDISPDIISSLKQRKTKHFDVKLTVPNYTKYGNYTLDFLVKGYSHEINLTNFTTVKDTGNSILVVKSATEKETLELFTLAENGIVDMDRSGFNVEKSLALLEKARLALGELDYDSVYDISKEIINIKEKAFMIDGLLNQIKEDIDEAALYEVDHRETETSYELALIAFERGDYDRALERINRAILSSSIEISGQIVSAKFMQSYSGILGGLILVVILIGFIGYKKMKINIVKSREKFLDKEESVIKNLIRDLQIRYFKGWKISKNDYERNVSDYELRVSRIEREKSQIASKNLSLFSLGRKKGKIYEKNRKKARIFNLIEEAQRNYFEKKSMSKKEYEERVIELRKELSEAEKSLKMKRYSFLLIVFVIFGIINMGIVKGQESAILAIQEAELHIQEMQDLGFPLERVNDTFNESILLYQQGDYIGAETTALYIGVIKNMAINVNLLIEEVETEMYLLESKGIDVSEADIMFNQGLEAFTTERYEEAEDFLNEALNKLEEIDVQLSLGRTIQESRDRNLISFLTQNWYFITLLICIFALAVASGYKATGSMRSKGRIKDLEDEAKALESSIKAIQKDYFEEKKMSNSDYLLSVSRYSKRLAVIIKELIILGHQDKINRDEKSV